MNIFVLDLDPRRCAQYHCDFHVGKMLTETAQILSTVLGGPYKPTHVNHPCVKWAAQCDENRTWLYALGGALGEEFEHRRGKKHASSLIINEIKTQMSSVGGAMLRLSRQLPPYFALAMPEHLRPTGPIAKPSVAVERYRAYYNAYKQGFWRQGTWVPVTWSKRDVPEWFEVRGLKPREEPTL